jgi:hypothetical protein
MLQAFTEYERTPAAGVISRYVFKEGEIEAIRELSL